MLTFKSWFKNSNWIMGLVEKYFILLLKTFQLFWSWNTFYCGLWHNYMLVNRTPNISHTTHIWVCVEFICKFRPELRISGVFSNFLIVHTPVFKLSSDRILTNLGSLDSSRREESNGSKIAFLASILTELLRKMYFTIRLL